MGMDFEEMTILQKGSPSLTTNCRPVVFPLNEETTIHYAKLLESMTGTLSMKKYLGLSANQVGVCDRLIVYHDGMGYKYAFNPEIIRSGKEMVPMVEQCLSFPGEKATKMRHDIITLKFQLIDGTVVEKVYKRKTAIVVQHELDHINGIPFIKEELDGVQEKA